MVLLQLRTKEPSATDGANFTAVVLMKRRTSISLEVLSTKLLAPDAMAGLAVLHALVVTAIQQWP